MPFAPAAFTGPVAPDLTAFKTACELDPKLDRSRCFLDKDVRRDQFKLFSKNVEEVQDRVIQAITRADIQELLKKEPSPHALSTLALELAFAGFGKLAGKALTSLASQMSRPIDPKAAEAVTKPFISAAKKPTEKAIQNSQNAEHEAEQTEKISALGMLRDFVNTACHDLQIHGANDADDHELLRMIPTFAPKQVDEYHSQIKSFLTRYSASGVEQLGRQQVGADGFAWRLDGGKVTRDTRCVWVRNTLLGTRTLYYERHDGSASITDTRKVGGSKLLDRFGETSAGFGAMPGADEHATLDRPVPVEFVEHALARHSQEWGEAPQEYTIDTRGTMDRSNSRPRSAGAKAGPEPAQGAHASVVAQSDNASELHDIFFGADDTVGEASATQLA